MPEIHGVAAIDCVSIAHAEMGTVGIRAMVGVDREAFNSAGDQMVERKRDQRLVVKRDQWFGPQFGQGAQTCAQSGPWHKGSGDVWHQAEASATRRKIASAAQAAPNPLSILTTETRLLQLVSIPSNAESPPRFAP